MSRSGKSTVGKCIVRLLEPTSGVVRIDGVDVTDLSRRQMRDTPMTWTQIGPGASPDH